MQGEAYYYLYNAHGDVVMLMNTDTGLIAGTYRYDAFGNVLEQTGTPQNSITYAGYQYDEESGLYYLNARYYNSATARFLTEDTFRGNYNDPLSLNRYTYCHNNPIAYTDPTGHFILTILAATVIGAAVGGIVEVVDQKLIQKKDEINWKAVAYEAGVGAVSGAFGGAAGVAKTAGKAVAKATGKAVVKTTVKTVAKKAAKTGVVEAAGGFAADVGRQVIVENKTLKTVDYGRAGKTALVSGASGFAGDALGQVSAINKAAKKANKVVDTVDDSVVKAAKGGSEVKIHGNSKLSTKSQHGYEIYNTETGDVLKTGISGQKLNLNGSSPRANTQVNKLNRNVGNQLYDARVVKTGMPNRLNALEWERENSLRLWNEGNSMFLHKRPRPWEE